MESFVLLDEGAWMTVGAAGLKMLSYFWWMPVLLTAGLIYESKIEKEKKYESR